MNPSNKRRLHHESLEGRRLLAANCVLSDSLTHAADLPHIESPTTIAGQAMLDAPLNTSASLAEGEAANTSPFYFDLNLRIDLVQEVGDRVFAIDHDRFLPEHERLVIFSRADDGSLSSIAELEVGFPVREMIVTEDQVLLFGNHREPIPLAREANDGSSDFDTLWSPESIQTVVATVNLQSIDSDAGVEVIRQEFNGRYHSLHHEGDQIVMVSSSPNEAVIQIYPRPRLPHFASQFNITADGLQTVASGDVPRHGITQVDGNDFYSASTTETEIVYLLPPGESNVANDGIRAPDEPLPPLPTASVGRYQGVTLSADANEGSDAIGSLARITEVEHLELGNGFLANFKIAEDGLTAIAVRTEYLGTGPVTHVDLIDLSGNEMTVFETVTLPELSTDVLVLGTESIVLRDYAGNALVIIDINQTTDIAAENRVRRVEVPETLRLQYQHLQVTEDRLIIWAERLEDLDLPRPATADLSPADPTGLRYRPGPSVLLTVSISQAEIIGDSNISDRSPNHFRRFVLIDSETQRFGFVSHDHALYFDAPNRSIEHGQPQFTFWAPKRRGRI